MIYLRLTDRDTPEGEERTKRAGPYRRLWLEDLDLLTDDEGETCLVAWYSVRDHCWRYGGKGYTQIEIEEAS